MPHRKESTTPRPHPLASLLCCGLLGLSAISFPALAANDDPLARLDFLIGNWHGEIDGKLGTGTGERVYERVADGTYVMMRHESRRPPQPKSPNGDKHHEISIYSWDRTGERLVLRQFVSEGFVNQYGCSPIEPPAIGFVCVTESVESGPGVRARTTLTKISDNLFEERFELAWPGEELELLLTNRWHRIGAKKAQPTK